MRGKAKMPTREPIKTRATVQPPPFRCKNWPVRPDEPQSTTPHQQAPNTATSFHDLPCRDPAQVLVALFWSCCHLAVLVLAVLLQPKIFPTGSPPLLLGFCQVGLHHLNITMGLRLALHVKTARYMEVRSSN
ncbi:hypothetical protein QBC35DRAFT_492008 [Podospora australis]|uniref:Uncharacterized protein n=1 Tax=Podospora australis TaxID=1536484 RepID=A0AAN7AKC2_9PEZI|nr:hypothetical protein QBC35DRAFT_492008 [Podospora australis]